MISDALRLIGVRGFIAIAFAVAFGAVSWRLSSTQEQLAKANDAVKVLREWRSDVVDAVRQASDNDKVTHRTAVQQITALGTSRRALQDAVETQNEAIRVMEQQTEEALRIAEAAERRRRAEVARAQERIRELRMRALTPAAPADVEEAIRAAQDEAYYGGA